MSIMQGQTHAKLHLLLQIVSSNTKGQPTWKHSVMPSHVGLEDPAWELWYVPHELIFANSEPLLPTQTSGFFFPFSVQVGSTQLKQLKRNVSLLCEQPPAECLLGWEGGCANTALTFSRADSGDKLNMVPLSYQKPEASFVSHSSNTSFILIYPSLPPLLRFLPLPLLKR